MHKRMGVVLLAVCVAGIWYAAAEGIRVVCPFAPAPRLRVGMTAVVSPQIGQLNLRALPAVDTGIITALYQGNRLIVLSGPSCNGHYLWWRVETRNGLRGWVAEGTWERYYLITAREADAVPPRFTDPVEYACPPRGMMIRRCMVP